jgi:uncharacterized protein (TIGR03382 family)
MTNRRIAIPTTAVALSLLLGANPVRANPIPCETLEAVRDATGVTLIAEVMKVCLDPIYVPDAATARRDFFPVSVSFTMEETPEVFRFTGSEADVSAWQHLYEVDISFPGQTEVITTRTRASGTPCMTLSGGIADTTVSLSLVVGYSCLNDPSQAFSFVTARDYEAYTLDWSQLDTGSQVECAATDSVSQEMRSYHYEVGVQTDSDTHYASLTVYPGMDPDGGVPGPDAGSPDAGTDPDDDNGGCAQGGSVPPAGLLLWSLLGLIWLGRRRRRR